MFKSIYEFRSYLIEEGRSVSSGSFYDGYYRGGDSRSYEPCEESDEDYYNEMQQYYDEVVCGGGEQ